MSRRWPVFVVCALGASLLAPADSEASRCCRRVSELERRVRELQAAVAQLVRNTAPVDQTVDCAAG